MKKDGQSRWTYYVYVLSYHCRDITIFKILLIFHMLTILIHLCLMAENKPPSQLSEMTYRASLSTYVL